MTVNQRDGLAEVFEGNRAHLRAVAYRMLGQASEADDVVQEAWLRLNRSDTSAVDNLKGWLTTVVARMCLDTLRSRRARREEPLDAPASEPVMNKTDGRNAETDALLADSVGLALLVVLDMLAPAERVAYVLHDLFDLAFENIAPIVGRSEAATRQLASRARRRIQGAPSAPDAELPRQRAVVDAFLAASRDGNFEALLALLDPEVIVRADAAVVKSGALPEVRGAIAVANTFKGRARGAQPALIDGAAGAVWAPGRQPRVVFGFTISDGKIVAIDMLADPETLAELDLVILGS
jgi:RNA polymerase sigma factor (sigma-70 family)